MCDPLTAAGLVLSAVGSGMGAMDANANARRGAKAANAATHDNIRRQEELGAKARARFDETVPEAGAEGTKAGMREAETQRAQAAADSARVFTNYSPAPASGDQVVDAEMARRSKEAAGRVADLGARKARLDAYDDASFGNRLSVGRAGSDIGTYSDFAGGVASLLPLEQSAAYTNSQKKPGMLGPALQLVGTGANMAGSFGLFGKKAPLLPGMPGYAGSSPLVGTGGLY
jgi:hypothetical protein